MGPVRHSASVLVMVVIVPLFFFSTPARATDLPHTDGNMCNTCHMVHNALGDAWLGAIIGGNVNLCQSCHISGGAASSQALTNAEQALPGPGLPTGTTPTGTSHRWDSGVAGHVAYLGGATTASTGTVTSGGAFVGPYAKTYTLTIITAGNVGSATFSWTATTPGGGSGSNLPTGTSVSLDEGVTVTFKDGTSPSFQVNDRWQIFVRAGLREPTSTAIQKMLPNGQMMCSTCHDPHSQFNPPFDPGAPASGEGRHFQVVANSADQLCSDCHAPRNVISSAAGSHPVGVPIPVDANHKTPTALPLGVTTSNVLCETCHDIHKSPDNDGALVRLTDRRAFCADCHTLADTNTPSAHLNPVTTSVLWPGGQYGTTFPAITDATLKGSCENCHQAHAWPDTNNPATTYPKLLVDQEENLCFTCHDTDGPAAKNVQTDFVKLRHHPVNDAEQVPGRPVECASCHNPHKALPGVHNYAVTATLNRNGISNVLRGADGVAVTYTGLTNFQTIPISAYSDIPKSTGVTYEYQICFKCHSGYSYAGSNNAGTATFTAASATVTGVGTTWTTAMAGSSIGRANDTRTYTITAVASATSLTIAPVYAGTTGSGTYASWNPPANLTPYYTTGTTTFTPGSTTVTGTGTTWNSGMVGSWIYGASNPTAKYKITAVANATSLTITPAYQ